MKITAKLHINTLLIVMLVVVIALTMFSLVKNEREVRHLDVHADRVVKDVFELNLLTYEYVYYGRERSRVQWQTKYAETRRDMEKIESPDGESRDICGRVMRQLVAIGPIFGEISVMRSRDGRDAAISKPLEERLVNNLLMTSQTIISDLFRLQEHSSQLLEMMQRKTLVFFFSMLSVLAVIIGAISYSMNRSIAFSLKGLLEAVGQVGRGNMEHRIAGAGNDEIGAVADAFNLMTGQLQKTYRVLEQEITSRANAQEELHLQTQELENEIAIRQKIEEQVLRMNTELELRVNERTAQLEAANKEIESFSYSVSHDLRAPLRHMTGFSKMLLESCRDKLGAEDVVTLERIDQAGIRMGRLIDSLLQISRVSQADLNLQQVDLSSLAREIINELREGQEERSVQVNIADGIVAQADPVLIRAVLQNLLGNAWKYTREANPALISFSMTYGDGVTSYCVADNGVGFDMAYADKLFEPFQRLHGSEFEGTGIGLATVQRIIRRHCGKVWATAKKGEGATFCFSLPSIADAGKAIF